MDGKLGRTQNGNSCILFYSGTNPLLSASLERKYNRFDKGQKRTYKLTKFQLDNFHGISCFLGGFKIQVFAKVLNLLNSFYKHNLIVILLRPIIVVGTVMRL